jgi:hypothetical protein
MPAKKRTTHRSTTGTKLYAVRDAEGQFVDIQTYKRAHAADIRASAGSETSAKSKKAVAKKKAATKKPATKKTAAAVKKKTAAKKPAAKKKTASKAKKK